MEFQEIIKQITSICKENNVTSLLLFGSYAKGTNTEKSDIDIVVRGNYNFFKLEEELQNIPTLKTIDIFEWETCKDNVLLREDIEKYGKKIY